MDDPAEINDHSRTLFNLIDEGFCVIEVIGGERGEALDYRFLETNASFERQTGLVDAVGRRMRALEPQHEQHWFDRYARIARTRKPERFEDRAEALGRWYDVYAFPIGDPAQRRVAILFRDVIERKRAEVVLRESEERQAFLLKLSDALRPLADAGEIQATTTRLLGTHLGVDRAMYAEATGEPGAETGVIRGQFIRPAAPGRRAPAPFPDHFTYESFGMNVMARRYSGEGLAVADVNADAGFDATERAAWARAGVQAAIVAPLVKGGRLVAELGVHSETPRAWTEAEISLVREAGERTWAAAERARAEAALRESEARLQSALSISTVGVLFWGPDFRLTQVNDAFLRLTGFTRDEAIGLSWQDLTPAEFHPVSEVALEELRERGESTPHEKQYFRKDGSRWWGLFAPRRLSDEEIVEFVIDVSEQRRGVERQKLLLAELQHRVRNILAVVRSMVRRTVEAGDNLEDVANHLDGRLASLARTQTLLTRAPGAGVRLENLIREELLAQNADDSVVDLSGPEVELASKAAEVLTLAIHELATNATKYGAFAQDGASLEVRWSVEQEDHEPDRLRLVWLERGVRMISAQPRRTGFGSELIQRRVPYDLRGAGRLELLPGGVRAEISFPLGNGASILATDAPGDLSPTGDDS